ncbi:MAG: EAL domain-containing protein [Wenzhouxiangellaceae bacterium]|nr:EAL domain-containing protein [Wenzhouxiangellaceae bacterium]
MATQVYLEASTGRGRPARRFDIETSPALIGRGTDCAVQINEPSISRNHAELRRGHDGEWLLADLESTNGSWLNGERVVEPVALRDGDVIHVGDQEMRFRTEDVATRGGLDERTQIGIEGLPGDSRIRVREFRELLDEERVAGFCQAVVTPDGRTHAYELLGRGDHPDLDASPGPLFALAASLGESVRFSEILRRRCFRDAARAGIRCPLFFNTHPEENRDPDRLLAELRTLRKRYGDLELVFEVHESAVTDLDAMASIRAELKRLGIGLAYDDFGAGQARLQELIEVPPDVLKFDLALVVGIEDPDSPKRRMLAGLNSMIQELGIRTLAEGIETEAQADACRELGIDLLQGFYFSRPRPIAEVGSD